MADGEIPLLGGNTNSGVVRIADTVRRCTGSTASTVHRFLAFLSEQKFNKAPLFLGIDKKGREILRYIPGTCDVTSTQWENDHFLISAATLLREFHECSSNYIPSDKDQWAYSYPDTSQHQVICHNDFAPYNLINNGSEFTAVIDFDLIGPGPRLRDVAYCAYWITPLSQHDKDTREHALADVQSQCRRLKLFCSTYGIAPDSALLDMISSILRHMADEIAMLSCIGAQSTANLKTNGHLAHWQRESEAFDAYRETIEVNL